MRGMKSVPSLGQGQGEMLTKYVASCIVTYMEYTHEQHIVQLIVYHIIWCPKRRRKVLTGKAAEHLEQIVHEVANEHEWQVIQLAIQPDHVHLFIRSIPLPGPRILHDSSRDILLMICGKNSPRSSGCRLCGHAARSTTRQAMSALLSSSSTSKGRATYEQETQGTPKYASGSSLSDTRTGSLAYGALPGVHQHG